MDPLRSHKILCNLKYIKYIHLSGIKQQIVKTQLKAQSTQEISF